MADTFWQHTVPSRGDGPSSEPEELGKLLMPSGSLELVTTPSATRQDLNLPMPETMLSCAVLAADTSLALHNRTNGSTVSLVNGDMAGMKLFSVSIYPSRSIMLWERPSWEALFEFIKANLDLLLRPGHACGTWFNDRECVHCLDVVIMVRNRDAAIEMGRCSGQLAIFDLGASREISIPFLSLLTG